MSELPNENVAPGPVSTPDQPARLSFGPFQFLSELDIPELHGVHGTNRINVAIRFAAVPEELDQVAPFLPWSSVTSTEYLLKIPDVARFHVLHGNEVRIDPHPGAPLSDLTVYLLGSIFGALCHQNGLLPLHGSALDRDGAATAFLGDSGAGKSTLAACLHARGFHIVSDDICLLEPLPSGITQVIPVAGWLKLWGTSFDHLGQTPEERHRVFSTDDKFRLYLQPRATPDGNPRIANLVFLERASSPDLPPRLEPLSMVETLALTMRFTYLNEIPQNNGSEAELFQRCASVLDDARGFRLHVPWDLARMDSVLDVLEATLLTPATP